MAMPETVLLTFGWMLAAVVGLLLGAIFFGGLWWTVRKGLFFRRPALLFSASLLLRMGIAIAGFYWVGREIGPAAGQLSRQLSWQALLLCLLGFVLARLLVLRLSRRPTRSATETRHAS